ncbi:MULTISPECIES: hypothetical protein [unclassified Yoonia]|uniref:hypothetical protein n=1 Tax=unclassified Yoonia TaxID=2629118 RepID=UPI002AFE4019|nr:MULTISPECIES: hypothetical protein [unclassified Yoonia]
MARIAICAFALSVMIACGPPPPPTATMLMRQSPIALCQSYSAARANNWASGRQAVLAEIERRQLFSAEEMQMILRGPLKIGASELVAICSWGPYFDVNTTTTSSGVNKQYVMGQFGPYVYTQNGLVTALQR